MPALSLFVAPTLLEKWEPDKKKNDEDDVVEETTEDNNDDEEEEKDAEASAYWELFLDLVLVAAVAAIADSFKEDPSWHTGLTDFVSLSSCSWSTRGTSTRTI